MNYYTHLIIRLFYLIPSFLVALIVQILLLFRIGRGQRGYCFYWKERYGFYSIKRQNHSIWIHASSIGEVNAVIPLIHALRTEFPEKSFVLTCMTPSGRQIAQEKLGSFLSVVYMPLDLSGSVKRFLKHFKPDLILLIETEIWPVLFMEASAHGIKIVIANARLSHGKWKYYRFFRPFFRYLFHLCYAILPQSPEEAVRFKSLGALRVYCLGNLKYDLSLHLFTSPTDWRKAVSRKYVVTLCSMHAEECTSFFSLLPNYPWTKDVLFVLVPRYLDSLRDIAFEMDAAHLSYLNKTQALPEDSKLDIWIIDSYGESLLALSIADIAFIGGSLFPKGGHNIIESCALGIPTLFGPFTSNFETVCRSALEFGAAYQIASAEGLLVAIDALLADPAKREKMGIAGKKFVTAHSGAVQKTFSFIKDLMISKNQ